MKKCSKFKKRLFMYSLILTLLSLIFLIYIFLTLKMYEDNQTNNFLISHVRKIDDEKLKKYLKDNNLEEKLLSDYKKMINDKDLTVIDKKDNKYDIVLNNRIMFNLETKVTGEKTKLGLFTYQEREITNINPNLKRGLVYYDVIIPSNWQLLVDNEVYTKFSKEETFESLEFMKDSNAMPKKVTYEINNLSSEKNIEVKNFLGNKEELNKKDFVYSKKEYFKTYSTFDEIKSLLVSEVDVLSYIHSWSLFLTKDLAGERYGYYKIKELIKEGSNLATLAYNWAHNVDITFTSIHTLKNPPFTNDSVKNCELYSKEAFMCEVYTEKNMIVGGKTQQDIMHDNVYFVNENNLWKMVNIKPYKGE